MKSPYARPKVPCGSVWARLITSSCTQAEDVRGVFLHGMLISSMCALPWECCRVCSVHSRGMACALWVQQLTVMRGRSLSMSLPEEVACMRASILFSADSPVVSPTAATKSALAGLQANALSRRELQPTGHQAFDRTTFAPLLCTGLWKLIRLRALGRLLTSDSLQRPIESLQQPAAAVQAAHVPHTRCLALAAEQLQRYAQKLWSPLHLQQPRQLSKHER